MTIQSTAIAIEAERGAEVYDGYAFNSTVYAWFVVLVMCGMQVASCMDRQIVTLMVEPLRRDFGITDVQISLLQGFAFALFYSLVSLPIGRVADRWNRTHLIIGGAALWTVATFLCMIAKNYPTLFLGRMLVGVGAATLVPASFSMLSDYFPRSKVSGAVSIVTGSTFFGSGLALAVGGFMIDEGPKGLVSLPIFGTVHGWQIAFGLMSIPSIVLIAVMFLVREPPRRLEAGEQDESASLGDIAAFLGANRIYWAALVGGITILGASQYGLSNWGPTFFIRTFGWSAAQIGLLYGMYFLVVATLASFVGGLLCDRLLARRGPAAAMLLLLAATAITLPVTEVMALTTNGTLSAVMLGFLIFSATIPFGPGLSMVLVFAPNRMRGLLLAAFMLCATLLGSGGGPWLLAAVTEYLFRDPQALNYSIALVDGVLSVLAIACFWLAFRNVGRFSSGAAATDAR